LLSDKKDRPKKRRCELKRHHCSFGVFLVAVTISAFVAGPLMPAGAAGPVEQQGLVDKSRVTFQSFMADPHMVWLQENLHQAKGLLIIPSLLKAGFFLGGSGGSGVLIVKDPQKGSWSQPAFYTLGSASFGLQIGGEAAEVIMMVRSQKALDALLKSSFKLGADTSVAVGPMGVGAKANVMADIFSFSRSKGAYAGISLEGAVIATRDKWNAAYYGKQASPVDILVAHAVSNPGSAELRAAVANAK
jgi:lipid-binding SYLF domain-containing protein